MFSSLRYFKKKETILFLNKINEININNVLFILLENTIRKQLN